MSDFIFISPGVQFREKDLTFVTTNLGLTTLGIVGETEKGPAFEPVFIGSKTAFRTKFGNKSVERLGNNLKYTLPYYADSYLSESSQMYVTRVLGLSGYNAGKAWVITASGDTGYDNMVVGVLRSKATYSGNTTLNFTTSAITISDAMTSETNILNDFKISVTAGTTSEYTVSLDESSSNFIGKVFGTKTKGKTTPIYVESVYSQLIKKAANDGNLIGVLNITEINNPSVSNYNSEYQTPFTPWVVSQLRGSTVDRLFRFISISDGNAANKEIKISIQNINFDNGEFDVIIRDFNDNDNNISVLESFTRCTLNSTLNSFIGRRIGTIGGEYDNKSSYVIVEMSEDFSEDSLPLGFEGYVTRSYTGLQSPKMIYKTSYETTDKINKTYLGISEKAFDGLSYKGNGINQNMFNFQGAVTTNLTKTKGFHLDIDATAAGEVTDGDYVVGEFDGGIDVLKSQGDQNDPSNLYNNIRTRKFTFAPYGGFDGWDEHRLTRTNSELFRPTNVLGFDESDYNAYLRGIRTFDNPEQISITLFSTPGINFFDNLSLVNDTIEMIEVERGDSLYVIDAPDLVPTDGYAEELSDLLNDTGIDSNYSATYGPYIEIYDRDNNINVFIPPTGEILRAIAYTDNKKYPWYAPAGLDRGAINAKRTRRILRQAERDTLYANRINTMVYFPLTGVSVFGQKTLQVKDSALDRINVRRLLLELRRLISNIAVRLLFEPNDQKVIDEFLTKVNPIMENVRRERGLFNYEVKPNSELNTPEAIDRNELYFLIRLQPTPALEFIGIEFSITPSGANFQNV
jgi:hypothetical protein